MPVMYGLPVAALLLADQGAVDRAVEVYACASRYDFVSKSRWFEDVVGHQIRTMAASLPAEAVELAVNRGRAQDWDVMAAEVLTEFGDCHRNHALWLLDDRNREMHSILTPSVHGSPAAHHVVKLAGLQGVRRPSSSCDQSHTPFPLPAV